ncbi:DNA-binding protein [Streptomyces erythrochromogenes]|uniref:DNA-binding protein n=1 Tax=Streptomyces erythrochromogenes TaxID=285574 RepID=UPI0036B74622
MLQHAQRTLERTRSPEQLTRLYYAAGQASSLLAAVSFDLGALAPAVSFARTAVQYGKTIGHGPLQAYAYGMLSFMAFWDGRPSESVRLARIAQGFGGLGSTARQRLYAIEARAHGHLRDDAEASRCIVAALEETGGRRDELHDDVAGEFAFDEARTAMSNATTGLLLRNGEAAEEFATAALTLLSNRPTAEVPLIVSGPAALDLARARLMRNEVEGAQEALDQVFQVPPGHRASGMMERLTAARMELTRPDFRGEASAVAVAEQIEEFSALSPARRLGAQSALAIES